MCLPTLLHRQLLPNQTTWRYGQHGVRPVDVRVIFFFIICIYKKYGIYSFIKFVQCQSGDGVVGRKCWAEAEVAEEQCDARIAARRQDGSQGSRLLQTLSPLFSIGPHFSAKFDKLNVATLFPSIWKSWRVSRLILTRHSSTSLYI